jgi:hypothetical protein
MHARRAAVKANTTTKQQCSSCKNKKISVLNRGVELKMDGK